MSAVFSARPQTKGKKRRLCRIRGRVDATKPTGIAAPPPADWLVSTGRQDEPAPRRHALAPRRSRLPATKLHASALRLVLRHAGDALPFEGTVHLPAGGRPAGLLRQAHRRARSAIVRGGLLHVCVFNGARAHARVRTQYLAHARVRTRARPSRRRRRARAHYEASWADSRRRRSRRRGVKCLDTRH